MTDLATIQKQRPEVFDYLLKAYEALQRIQSFDDLERVFLRGQGLSKGTYDNYRRTSKEMYALTGGLAPFQWDTGWIEKFYDEQRAAVGLNTACHKMYALKNLLGQIEQQFPFWTSPYSTMGDGMREKLFKTTQGDQKPALTHEELKKVLRFLKQDSSVRGKQNYAMVLFLVTTGLRAAELCAASFDDLTRNPFKGTWSIKGIGKGKHGGKPFVLPVHADALEAAREAFEATTGREYRTGDPLFLTTACNRTGGVPARMKRNTLWVRLHAVGERLKAQGFIRTEIEFSPHLFRRTFLTLLSQAGMPLRDLQAAARHSDIKTTAAHYLDAQESTIPYVDKILNNNTDVNAQREGA